MYCPKCYRQIPDDSAFCPNCGADVSTPTCIRCGNPILRGDKFCKHCGIPVSGYKEPPKSNVNWTFSGGEQPNHQEPAADPPNAQNDPSQGERLRAERQAEEKKAGNLFVRICVALIALMSLLSVIPRSGGGSSKQTTAMSASEYKAMCSTINYEDLARDPDSKKGSYYTFEGEVVQVIESGNSVELRMNVTPVMFYDEISYYEDTIYVATKLKSDGKRILEGDIIRIYGECTGLKSYYSILGQKISIPGINAAYWEIT